MNPIDMMVTDYNCEYLGLSRLCLMENAGKSLADEVAKLSTFKFSKPVKIAIFTGSGGNGGDGFVAARHLLNHGFEVEVYMISSINQIKSEDALINLKILLNLEPRISRLHIYDINDSLDLKNIKLANSKSNEYIILDGLLGTGIKGKLRSKVKKVVKLINTYNALKIAIDVPSGLDPLTGEIFDIAVKPDYTVSFHKIKTGIKLAGEKNVGNIITCDIGIPLEAELFVGDGDLLKLNKRSLNSHKGNNGKILVIGGSKDYYGAPAIAGLSAIATGADLVYIYAPESATNAIKNYSLNLILKSSFEDYLNLDDLDVIMELVENVDAVLIGPGASQKEKTAKLFNTLAVKIKKPIIFDADALKLVNPFLIAKREDIVISPHYSEFKSFFSNTISELNIGSNLDNSIKLDKMGFNKVNEKIANFQKVTKSISGVVVLKGEFDYIFQNNKLKINGTGNPGMTVGGTGDCLAGIIASFLSQGLNAFDAGTLATYFNGRAGDLAMEANGFGFGAEELTYYLTILMAELK